MSEERPVLMQHAERIAKLEEQTRELQQQVKRLQTRAAKRKKSKAGWWQSLSASDGALREVLLRIVLVLIGFICFSMYAALRLGGDGIEVVPGGAALWGPVWWIAVFLLMGIGVFLFVSSRE